MALHAGLKALYCEVLKFTQTRARLGGDWVANWMVAYKGILLQELEVWPMVVALGMKSASGMGMVSSGGGAIAALLLTWAFGAAGRAPLQQGPDNAINFTVLAMIVAYGTYWTMEGIGRPEVWPLSDRTLLILVAFYLDAGLAVATAMRTWVRREAV